ncbi:hypothetical protein KUCAC02_007566, partial [Chaenocephalus aceratus]
GAVTEAPSSRTGQHGPESELLSGVSGALSPVRSKQVLSSSGLMWDARVQAVRQNHFGSNECSQVCPCSGGSGDTCYFPLIRAQTAVSGSTERERVPGLVCCLSHRLIL